MLVAGPKHVCSRNLGLKLHMKTGGETNHGSWVSDPNDITILRTSLSLISIPRITPLERAKRFSTTTSMVRFSLFRVTEAPP